MVEVEYDYNNIMIVEVEGGSGNNSGGGSIGRMGKGQKVVNVEHVCNAMIELW